MPARPPSPFDVIALIADLPEENLARGKVGTVVERLGEQTSLVEFSDDNGRAYAIVPCPDSAVRVLHYDPR